MVRVFHLNRRLLRRKLLIGTVAAFLFVCFFEVAHHAVRDCPAEEPVDVVYTWVNGSDPKFQRQLELHLRKRSRGPWDSSHQRFDDKNELLFSLRSLEKFAPWVNHVYIVTNGQIPSWLNLDCEGVTVVTHQDIFPDKSHLPTFSSPAIEANLYRIPGLSRRFVYFNDDVFLRAPVYREDFFSPDRGFSIYLAWVLPMCAPDCSWLYVADGHCDSACNNPSCQMDGGDCRNPRETVLGDVVVKFEDYEAQELNDDDGNGKKTNYQKIISSLLTENGTGNGRAPAPTNETVASRSNFNMTDRMRTFDSYVAAGNVSRLIEEHNQRVMLVDKLKRQKAKKKRDAFYRKLRTFSRDSVDAYSASLQHTNRVLNRLYGFSLRKVPSHAPIMVDGTLMEDVRRKFETELDETSRGRFRSADDLQFSFAYYYYVVHEKVERSPEEIFDEFDTDSSGTWSDTEARTVVAKLYDVPLYDEVVGLFRNIVANCSKAEPPPPVISKDLVTNCSLLSRMLRHSMGRRRRYRFHVVRDADKKYVHFKMLTSNVSDVLKQLDDVRKNEKKFVCLNDNLDPSRRSDNEVVKELMLDLYVSLFPNPSRFELPEQYRNRHSHVEDYAAELRGRRRCLLFCCFSFLLLTFAAFYRSFRRRLCVLIRPIFC